MSIEILNPNGTTTTPDCTGQPTPAQMEEWVGGHTERILHPFLGVQVFRNKEGRVRDLPYNHEASVIFGGELHGPIVVLTEENQLT